jgi:acetyltransferase-like isoleucine patch superfamily enzyme
MLHAGLPVPRIIRPLIRATYRCGVWAMECKAFMYKLLWVEPVLRSVCHSVGTHLRAERLPYIRGKGVITLGDHVNLSGQSCFYFLHDMPQTPAIEIGSHVFVGNGCTFSCAAGISVGDHGLISAGVRIHDNDGHPTDPTKRRAGAPLDPASVRKVVIGDNVWIGAEAIVLKGVHIGDNAIVGSGAVVTSDVPANAVVAGNPAGIVHTKPGS